MSMKVEAYCVLSVVFVCQEQVLFFCAIVLCLLYAMINVYFVPYQKVYI